LWEGVREDSRRESTLERERAGWFIAAREESCGRETVVLGRAAEAGSEESSSSDLSVDWQQPC
jgi:hypothetical protein